MSRILTFTVGPRKSTRPRLLQSGSTAAYLRYVDRVQVIILERPDLAAPLLMGIKRMTDSLRQVP